ncbi:MAG: peptidoglycan-associated lipoprotein Pal [Bdellovibrionales bacterium]|nr:peptidoglycan-associated lipoprotein Pal [Bdellovibrionales bacterium]
MNQLKKIGFLSFVLALGLGLAACSKNKDVSSTADQASDAASDSQSMSEENLDDMTVGKLSLEEAQQVLKNLTTIYFGYDQSSISKQDRADLKKIAAALKTIDTFELSIEGHCDERGSNEYNLALGDRRANAVYDYLLTLGVSNGQLRTVSYGEERPAMTGENENAWSKNRRAELVKR